MSDKIIEPINADFDLVSKSVSKSVKQPIPYSQYKILKSCNLRDVLDVNSNVDCYVLDTPEKTAVIGQKGMAIALGLSPSGTAFPRFMALKSIVESGGANLQEKVAKPLKIQGFKGGASIHGYTASLLIDICNAIIKASSNGTLNRPSVLAKAQTITGACGKAGIDRVIYAVAGYNPTYEATISAFKAYVAEEAKKYEKEFPTELYLQWARLYAITLPERGWPWDFRHLTIKHIYTPLAQSDGRLLKLLRDAKAGEKGNNKKLFQFLNEVGTRALRIHLGRVLEMAESSQTREEYDAKIKKRFNPQQELDFLVPQIPN